MIDEKVLGYTCPKCATFHQADFMMALHWDMPYIHVCGTCKQSNGIKQGRVANRKGVKHVVLCPQ